MINADQSFIERSMTDSKNKYDEKNPWSAFIRYNDAMGISNNQDGSPIQSVGQNLYGKSYVERNAEGGYTQKPNWSSYSTSRMAMRVFSRGVMGATFYTLANHAISRQLPGYSPLLEMGSKEFGSFTEYPLRYVARFFDHAYGTPIKALVKAVAPAEKAAEWADQAVWFRNKQNFGDPFGHNGRSIGAEVVGLTFDFAAGSVGDSWGRQVATLFDPNVNHSWDKDGHFNAKQFGQSVLREGWRIASKSQGEDWAAALPYIYQCKMQRQGISRFYPGFKFSSDRQLNGGSWRVNELGQIEESYMKAGVIDLQLRFTGYNWYTLMYREAYDTVGEGIQSLIRHQGKTPNLYIPDNPLHAGLDAIGHLVRYGAKSFVKANIYMMPAVPFFWATRSPQTKYKGIGIYLDPNEREKSGIVEMPNGRPFTYMNSNEQFDVGGNNYILRDGEGLKVKNRILPDTPFGNQFNPFAKEHTRGLMDSALNPLGEACYKTADAAFKAAESVGLATRANKPFIHDWVNASASYTPYMIAKAETALRWDKPQMDRAIYRFIDGVAALRLGEIKGGLSDIRDIIIHPPTNQKVEEFMKEEQQKALQRTRELKAAQARRREEAEQPETVVAEVEREPMQKESTLPITPAAWTDKALRERFYHETNPPPGSSLH